MLISGTLGDRTGHLLFLINKTKFGLHVRAVACSSRTAGLLGIKIDRVIAMVFLLAGALAGLAGITYGMKYNIYPTMGNVGKGIYRIRYRRTRKVPVHCRRAAAG